MGKDIERYHVDFVARSSATRAATDEEETTTRKLLEQSKERLLTRSSIDKTLSKQNLILGPFAPIQTTEDIEKVEHGEFVRTTRDVYNTRDGDIIGTLGLRSPVKA